MVALPPTAGACPAQTQFFIMADAVAGGQLRASIEARFQSLRGRISYASSRV